MDNNLIISKTVERTAGEINQINDSAAFVGYPLNCIDDRNFHWLELVLAQQSTRVEAIRHNSQPDQSGYGYSWEHPLRFRVITQKDKQSVEQIVERGHRGSGIPSIEICGTRLDCFFFSAFFNREDFVSYSFRVGRQCQTVTRKVKYEETEAEIDQFVQSSMVNVVRPLIAATSVPKDQRLDPDVLGQQVREAWIAWAMQQPDPKPSWLVPYDEMDEADKEADRLIGEHIARYVKVVLNIESKEQA